MTATETPGADAGLPEAGEADAAAPSPGPAGQRAVLSDRLAGRLALGFALAPFVVAGVALLVAVGGDYQPVSDHALTEMQVRGVGRDEVLVGLYSRGDWNHPGPALFHVLAPFYWVTGGLSASMNIGALAINGAAVAGMGLIARRRGGTPLMLVTLLGCALLMRMLGADFLQDPWNCFVTTLPFGLLIFLAWAMWGGEAWALPACVAVATFLAQVHVGFLALAPPLVAWGVVGLGATTALEVDGEARSRAVRRGVRAGLVSLAVLVVAWLPPAIEAIRHSPGNATSILRWFRHPEEEAHSLADGWRVMSGQFGGVPEWLTVKRDFTFLGESPYIEGAPAPWLLVVLVVAGVVLWRHDLRGARGLLATVALSFAVGVVAVARTVGLAFDYRLRWTYLPAMIGAVVIAWAGWTVVAERWPRAGSRVLAPLALVGLAAVGGVNVVTAATAGTPQNGDSASMTALTSQVLDNLPETDRTILVTDGYHSGAWHARGLVLQLERRGIDVGVEASRADEYGRHRVLGGSHEIGVVLVVTMDDTVDDIAGSPGMRLIAEWTALPEAEMRDLLDERDEILADVAAGRIEHDADVGARLHEIAAELVGDDQSIAYRAAVFVDETSGTPAPSAG
jgi:uncharacterized membrane protein